MALLPTRMPYQPLVGPENMMSLLPPIMGMRTPQVMPAERVPAPTPAPTPTPTPAPTPTPTPAPTPTPTLAEMRGLVDGGADLSVLPNMADVLRDRYAYSMPASPYVRPTLDPSLDYATRNNQQGYFFVTNKGKAAKTKASKSGFIPLNPNWQYRIVNERGKNQIVASGTGEQGLQDVYTMAQRLSAEQGKKADWKVEVFDPSVGSWKVYADDDPPGNVLGTVADIALPVIGAAIAGPLGAAAGSGLSSVAQGRSLENTLLRSALSAGASAAGGALLGEAASSAGTAAGQAAGEVAGQAAGEAAFNVVGPSIIVEAAKQAAPSVAGTVLGGAAGGALANVVTPPSPPTENQIIVRAPETLPISDGLLATAPLAAPVVAATLPTAPTTTTPEVPPTENQIVVRPPTPETLPISEGLLGTGALATALPTETLPLTENQIVVEGQRPPTPETLPISEGLLATAPLVTLPTETLPLTPETGNSLLDEIIKYYSLGSIGLDALGGALGLGGGGGQAAAPYVSQLGPMPTFTRGEFTPYTGDYETYGFGPEFNFFGGPAPITPTAPAMGVLGPNTPVDTTLI